MLQTEKGSWEAMNTPGRASANLGRSLEKSHAATSMGMLDQENWIFPGVSETASGGFAISLIFRAMEKLSYLVHHRNSSSSAI